MHCEKKIKEQVFLKIITYSVTLNKPNKSSVRTNIVKDAWIPICIKFSSWSCLSFHVLMWKAKAGS